MAFILILLGGWEGVAKKKKKERVAVKLLTQVSNQEFKSAQHTRKLQTAAVTESSPSLQTSHAVCCQPRHHQLE